MTLAALIDHAELEWRQSKELVPYDQALEEMRLRVAGIQQGELPEQVWLLEHPPLYTGGTSATPQGLLDPRFPVYESGRGGQYTYHGPGQRVAYVMLDLKRRTPDLRKYVFDLENWLIATLQTLGVQGERRVGRVGIWVSDGKKDKKVAAIGVRVQRWVTCHGVSINVNPDLSHFTGIVPCGLREHGVTSLEALGIKATMAQVDAALKKNWKKTFGA